MLRSALTQIQVRNIRSLTVMSHVKFMCKLARSLTHEEVAIYERNNDEFDGLCLVMSHSNDGSYFNYGLELSIIIVKI